MKVLFLAAMLLAAPALNAQQDEDDWLEECKDYDSRRRVAYCEVRHSGYRQSSGGTFTAEPVRNGGVSIRGWDRDSVHVEARIRAVARTEEAAREIARNVRISAERGTIGTDGPSSDRNENWNVSFVVYAPRQTNVRAETQNGPIGLTELDGNIDVRATNGPISLRDLAGDVRARAQNGPITIRLTGSRWRGAGLDAETQNGPMSIGFPITVQGRGLESRITTTLGSGGPTIRARTHNGPLAIRRP